MAKQDRIRVQLRQEKALCKVTGKRIPCGFAQSLFVQLFRERLKKMGKSIKN